MKQQETLKPLFARIAEQDGMAFTKVYNIYRPDMITYIERLVQDYTLAQDVVQDMFIKLWEKGTKLKEVDNPVGWMRDVACKISINYYRRQKLFKKYVKRREEPEDSTCGHSAVNFNFMEDLLHKALLELPGDLRQMMRMHLREGKGRKELAKDLGLTEKVARVKLEKAQASVRAFIMRHLGWLAVPVAWFMDLFR